MEPRSWRLSVEIRSIRLTACTANIFVQYVYDLLEQRHPFRTSPSTLARRSATTYLPHGFAAYTLVAGAESVQARLEDPLRVEVWRSDMYQKDILVGQAEFSLGGVFDRPIQFSASMPSMVCGFRVLDQACPIIGAAERFAPERIGLLRLLIFLEDLGPARDEEAIPAGSLAATVPPPPGGGTFGGVAGGSAPATAPLPGAEAERPSALPTASMPIRESAEYATAFELELWKRSEEEKFRAQLKLQEAALRESLEESYRRKELDRAKEFRQKQSELRDVEQKVRKKFQELQQREVTLLAEQAQVESLREETKRRADLAIQEHDEASKRLVAEAQQALQLERDRCRHLERRATELEEDLENARQRYRELDAHFAAFKRQAEEAPSARLQQDLLAAQAELSETKQRAAALAASRDHFRSKVQELCQRLLSTEPHHSAFAGGGPAAASSSGETPPMVLEAAGVGQALQKIQEDLAELARDWSVPAKAVAYSARKPPAVASAPKPLSRAVAVVPPPVMAAAGPLPTRSRGPVSPGIRDEVVARAFPAAKIAAAHTAPAAEYLQWLRSQQVELLQSGLYSESDPVLVALEARISEALQALATG